MHLWASKDGLEYNTIATNVKKGCIMTVVNFSIINSKTLQLNEEWKDGAYLLLAPDGKLGWSGAGWLKKLPTRTNAARKTVG